MNDHSTTTPRSEADRPTRSANRLSLRWVPCGLIPLLLVPVGCTTDAAGPVVTTTVSATTVPASTQSTSAPTPSAVATTIPETSTTSSVPDRLDIVASEFTWSGLPTQLPPGSYPLTLRNDGTEIHEIRIFENTEGMTLEELFALGPVDIEAHVESAAFVIAGPGATSEQTTVELGAGTYEVVCFIPASSDQQPHFAHGMHATIQVG